MYLRTIEPRQDGLDDDMAHLAVDRESAVNGLALGQWAKAQRLARLVAAEMAHERCGPWLWPPRELNRAPGLHPVGVDHDLVWLEAGRVPRKGRKHRSVQLSNPIDRLGSVLICPGLEAVPLDANGLQSPFCPHAEVGRRHVITRTGRVPILQIIDERR